MTLLLQETFEYMINEINGDARDIPVSDETVVRISSNKKGEKVYKVLHRGEGNISNADVKGAFVAVAEDIKGNHVKRAVVRLVPNGTPEELANKINEYAKNQLKKINYGYVANSNPEKKSFTTSELTPHKEKETRIDVQFGDDASKRSGILKAKADKAKAEYELAHPAKKQITRKPLTAKEKAAARGSRKYEDEKVRKEVEITYGPDGAKIARLTKYDMIHPENSHVEKTVLRKKDGSRIVKLVYSKPEERKLSYVERKYQQELKDYDRIRNVSAEKIYKNRNNGAYRELVDAIKRQVLSILKNKSTNGSRVPDAHMQFANRAIRDMIKYNEEDNDLYANMTARERAKITLPVVEKVVNKFPGFYSK